jgi:hypothetical protein
VINTDIVCEAVGDTGDIIYLEEALVNLLDLPYDEVTLEVVDHLRLFEDKL